MYQNYLSKLNEYIDVWCTLHLDHPVVAVVAGKVDDICIVVLLGLRGIGLVIGHIARLLQGRCLRVRPLCRVVGSVTHYPFVVLGAVIALGAYEVLRLEVAVPLLYKGRCEMAEARQISCDIVKQWLSYRSTQQYQSRKCRKLNPLTMPVAFSG